ncbi:MAG: transglycosylase SLT domain-containing protein [Hydrogenophaga sp.]|uniref:lytic transglycosylase domain-containing protein n=1 Tax=Hydrogenophaga sp. TaxID=1904254 RepID=UPI001DB84190|nr:lytic transglycosylase domain-containing protein [Hydrogenophaga sp.]MBW0170325.1 lytic transglycosylase domain-containing protein [Hydrogenophaga sp.]MBW0185289.1 lytic transglycosylase domain-containing protein [Hydrogenophaga sp.]
MAGLVLPGSLFAQGAGGDAALLDMRSAFSRGNNFQLANLLPSVRGHALEPLAQYWEARARLDIASPTDIRAALDRMAGSYWEDRLRNDWLLQLGKARDWSNFDAELPRYRMNDDRQVRCYALLRDVATGRTSGEVAAPLVQANWHAQRDADDGCASAAKALLDTRHLKPQAVWQRARLAMDLNRPRVATQAVAMIDPDLTATVESIANDPAKYLDEKLTAIRPRTKELVTLAIVRLAANDPAAAALEMDRTRWKAQLTKEERSWIWGVIGKRTAQKLQPEALTHFANGEDSFMHDEHLAWKARAGMRAGEWVAVREAIDAMSESQQKEPTWLYWKARAIQTLKQPDAVAATAQARDLFERIASSRDFYEQLALEELGRPITVPPAPAALTAEEVNAAQSNPGLRRALIAIRLGLRSEGVREWNYTVGLHNPGGMGERELLAAAALACQHELWDRCINTSLRTSDTLDHTQRFPTPHRAQVVSRANEIGLDPAYVYGLIRQESRFITDARSGVGASGLMQVMPATARWTARKIGLTDFKPSQITERDTNIQIGTAYLKFALDDFQGSLPLAAAAYNAGPGRSRQWRNGPVLPGEVWAENIPFEETRDYVKRVLANTTNYAALITGQPQSLRARLGTVGPRPNGAPTINPDLP